MELKEASEYLFDITQKIVSEYHQEVKLSLGDVSLAKIIQSIETLKTKSILLEEGSENVNTCINIVLTLRRFGIETYSEESFYKKGVEEIALVDIAKKLLKRVEKVADRHNELLMSSAAKNGIQSPELTREVDKKYGQYKRHNPPHHPTKKSSRPWEEVFMSALCEYRSATLSDCFDKTELCPLMSNNVDCSLEKKRIYFPKIKWVQFTELAGLKKSGMKPAAFPRQSNVQVCYEELKHSKLSTHIEALVNEYGVVKYPMITPDISLMKGVTFVEDTTIPNELESFEQILSYFCTRTGNEESFKLYYAIRHLVFYPFRTPWPVCIDPYLSLALGIPYLPISCVQVELADWHKVDKRVSKYLAFFASKIARSRFIALRENSSTLLLEKLKDELT